MGCGARTQLTHATRFQQITRNFNETQPYKNETYSLMITPTTDHNNTTKPKQDGRLPRPTTRNPPWNLPPSTQGEAPTHTRHKSNQIRYMDNPFGRHLAARITTHKQTDLLRSPDRVLRGKHVAIQPRSQQYPQQPDPIPHCIRTTPQYALVSSSPAYSDQVSPKLSSEVTECTR